MSPTLADRFPAGTYVALAIAVSWAMWIPILSAVEGPLARLATVPGAFGPLVAAAAVTRLRGDSVRAWLAGALDWRRSPRWYALAVTVPVLVSLALGAVVVALAGGLADGVGPSVAALFAFNLVFATLLGGGQEEFGWRGFALPHLQARHDALTASVVLGLVWALWHAPLFVFDVYALSPALYTVAVVAFSVVLTWLYNASRACLPAAVLMHGTINASVNVPLQAVGGPSALPVPFAGLLAGGFGLLALAIVARHGRESLAAGPAMTPTGGPSGDAARSDARAAGVSEA